MTSIEKLIVKYIDDKFGFPYLYYDKVDEYAGANTSGVILLLGDGVAKSAVAIDKEIIAASTLIQILNTI